MTDFSPLTPPNPPLTASLSSAGGVKHGTSDVAQHFASQHDLVRSLVQGFAGAVAQLDHRFVVQSASAGFEAVFAQSGRATVAGFSLAQLLGPSAWALVANETRRATAGDECSFVRHVGAAGSRAWLEFCITPNLQDAFGKHQGLWLAAHNVEARVAQERELEVAWNRLEQFSRATTEGIVFFSDGIIVDCNPALTHILGVSREALIGESVMRFFQAADQHVAQRHLKISRELPYPATLQRADGSMVEVEITGRIADANALGTSVASVRDVSQLKRVGESLMRSQARYRILVENASEAIVVSQGQKVVFANPAAAKMFGVTVDDLFGIHMECLVHPIDRAIATAGKRFRESITASVEMRLIYPPLPVGYSGDLPEFKRLRHAQVAGAVVDWEGKPASMIFMTDVTELRESQNMLLQSLQQERELGELKTRFVSMASHEFRTPLATIQTSTELLQHYLARLSTEQRDEALEDIFASVQRMQAMISNFLTLGRMQANTMLCNPKPLVLAESLQQMVAECANADEHQHLIVLDVDPHIPMDQRFMLDDILLRLVVGNLVGNACKYSLAGSMVWVRVKQTPSGKLEIEVADSGIGIPAADLPRLFEPFHRASNTGEIRGTGVGLAIVRQALAAHGARVEVISEINEGSRFVTEWPWNTSSPEPTEQAEEPFEHPGDPGDTLLQ